MSGKKMGEEKREREEWKRREVRKKEGGIKIRWGCQENGMGSGKGNLRIQISPYLLHTTNKA